MPSPRRGPRRPAAATVLGAVAFPFERDLDAEIEKRRKAISGIHLSYHTHRSDRSEEGFPDRVYVGLSGLLFRELKIGDNTASPAQRQWLADINAAAGIDWDGLVPHPDGLLLPAAIWREADWYTGRIETELRAIARPRGGGPPAARKTPDMLRCGEDRTDVAVHGHRCATWGPPPAPSSLPD